jgi:hypothetical protein
MGVAHTYAELQCELVKLREELRLSIAGRLIAEVITVNGGEPRLSIGELQLPEEHAKKLAAWIEVVFQRDDDSRCGGRR